MASPIINVPKQARLQELPCQHYLPTGELEPLRTEDAVPEWGWLLTLNAAI